MRAGPEEDWVGCGICSDAFRTRAELIHHIEHGHMQEPDCQVIVNIERTELSRIQRQLRATSGNENWTEHMFLDKNVMRCKGLVGKPYYQLIDNNRRKVQKLCPATSVVSEPKNGKYKLQMYTRHAGHPSTPLVPLSEHFQRLTNVKVPTVIPPEPLFGLSKPTDTWPQLTIEPSQTNQLSQLTSKSSELCLSGPPVNLPQASHRPRGAFKGSRENLLKKIDTHLRWIGERIIKLNHEALKEVFAKVEELKQSVKELTKSDSSIDNSLIKRKLESIQPDDVEKAIDQALENYIKATKPELNNHSVQSSTPKIVNTFSLKDEEDIEEFVKDVEHLINNGKSYEVTENMSKLGHAKEHDVKFDPYGRVMNSTSFNDSYKDFIVHELRAPISGINTKRHRESVSENFKTKRSIHGEKFEAKKINVNKRILSDSMIDSKTLISDIKIEPITMSEDNSESTETLSQNKIASKRTMSENKMESKGTLSENKIKSKRTMSENKLESKRIRFENKIQSKESILKNKTESKSKNKIESKRTVSKNKIALKGTILDNKIESRVPVSENNNESKRTVSTNKIESKITMLENKMESRRKTSKEDKFENVKVCDIPIKFSHNKPPKFVSKMPKIRILDKAKKLKRLKGRPKLGLRKSHLASKAMLKNAPKPKPESEKNQSKPIVVQAKNYPKEEFVVKERENDCNILIIRM